MANDLDSAEGCFGKWVANKVCRPSLSQDQTDAIFEGVYKISQAVVAAAPLPEGGEGLEAFALKDGAKIVGDSESMFGKYKGMPLPPKNPATPVVSTLR